jgi:hypothetical protein
MMQQESFTSLPPHEEAQFVVFERRTQEAQMKALIIALVTSPSRTTPRATWT